MSVRVLITDGLDKSAVDSLVAGGFDVVEKFYESEELGAALKDFDVAVIRSATKIRAEHIEAEKGGKLKLIIRAGVGIDNIDVAAANAAGITVTNSPKASTNAVAELAIAHLFACARSISVSGYAMRNQQWDKKIYEKNGFELAGKTVGVIGYGRIGQSVGNKCQALGMKVLSSVHRNKPEGLECDTMHFVSMEELYKNSDIIVITTPKVDAPFINAETIKLMKDGVVIVNVSRGANADEAVLLEGLNSGKIAACGLDVWYSDKNPNWELASHPRVSCTPHTGAGTKEAKKRMAAEVVDIIKGFKYE